MYVLRTPMVGSWVRLSAKSNTTRRAFFSHTNLTSSFQSDKLVSKPCDNTSTHTCDVIVDEGKGPMNTCRDKNQGKHHRRKAGQKRKQEQSPCVYPAGPADSAMITERCSAAEMCRVPKRCIQTTESIGRQHKHTHA